ncbi:hypothetical protein BHF72_0238 [Cloacibacterium normanense]|uniref:Uncharacterized protein n=1 Tax=Cloacibacterium normanense TaxID=237258 RepID=A0A1E5UCP1_9FLAO|nr:hypothetical protein BHF72_0238 [Cloacibacterium normanense]SDO63153.1 hypothetical protein SAMN04489756_11251 [Cloacibacterium normanense]
MHYKYIHNFLMYDKFLKNLKQKKHLENRGASYEKYLD